MAVAINIRAPQDILRLARQMPNLKSMMHVSTAFSNCINHVVEERIYPAPFGYKELILMTEKLPDKVLEDITPRILDSYPNTYAYTKQVAEDVVRQEGYGLPVGIMRPSIVVSTYKDPLPSWINNMYGATGVAAGAGVGLLRALHCDPYCNANIVPVDMCVNSLIAAAWEVSATFEKSKKDRCDFSPPVYHYESSNEKPINWNDFMEASRKYGMLNPSARAVWYYSFSLYKSYLSYLFAIFFLHVIPALIVDGALLCMGKSPRMTKMYTKIHKFSTVISYFSTRQWVFRSGNVQRLIGKMSEKDKKIFFCDLKDLDWDIFFQTYLRGVRVYLMQDPMDSLPEAKKKWNRLYWAHQTTKAVAGFLLFRILWSLLSFLYRIIL
ncbi:fatty acyl-CoA reductase wat-like [Anoplophora glabripennis]|uniref:fatty acyl-CoA reductase wat-like n=1 Tax=Anoplophora glabripennis TaxID=217634 RepID=UPI00087591C6|nr:fatty acyl-CoA reductase wat-like [Anoplophora glabripennis]